MTQDKMDVTFLMLAEGFTYGKRKQKFMGVLIRDPGLWKCPQENEAGVQLILHF